MDEIVNIVDSDEMEMESYGRIEEDEMADYISSSPDILPPYPGAKSKSTAWKLPPRSTSASDMVVVEGQEKKVVEQQMEGQENKVVEQQMEGQAYKGDESMDEILNIVDSPPLSPS